jgi:putative ABC transport system permease protein
MNWLGECWRRLRFRLHRAQFEQDLAEEMRLHLELRAEAKQAGGMAAEGAEAAARRQFGNATRLREISREAWGWTVVDTLAQDLRYGLRTLAANPGFAATAVLSLALGIGANTAIFSLVNAVMLRSLPVEDPQRLAQVVSGDSGYFTNPIWEQIRDRQNVFSGALAYSQDRFDLAAGGQSQFAEGMWVSGDFFRVLGVPAVRGRVFRKEDDRRGGGANGSTAVISYRFWKGHFQKDPEVVGKTVRLNRQKFEIVGVTPPWFAGLEVDRGYDVAIPIGCEPLLHTDRSALDQRSWWWLRVLARLGPERTVQQAADRLKAMAPEVNRATLPPNWSPQDQKEYLKRPLSLRPAATGFSGTGNQYRTALFTLMGIVGLVLLIACANIANLLLARAAARRRELSVRLAIGASRARVIRQLMTESVLLAMLGAAGGLLLSIWGSRLLLGLISTTGSPLEIDVTPDVRVLGFTMGVAVLTAVLFGFAPALRATRLGLNAVLKESSRGALRGSSRFHLGKALVTGQVALSLVLLVGGGLFLGTLRNLLTVDAGFRPENILLVSGDVQQAGLGKERRLGTFRQIVERLRAVPGVVSASSSSFTPISNMIWNGDVYPEGFAAGKPAGERLVYFNRVSPGYFRTVRTPLLIGRDFNEHDDLKGPRVMIIGQTTARRFFGTGNPIGKTIGMDEVPGQRDVYQVIGVVKDIKYGQLNEETLKTAYLACAQDPDPWPSIVFQVRAAGPLEGLLPSIRTAISGVNGGMALEFRYFETQVRESLLQPRIVALLSTAFAALALLLAMVGLYGVTAYGVAQRQGEIGIRMALGAQRRAVIWLVLRDIVVLLAVGMALGLVASLAAGRLVTSLLYGVRSNEPAQLAATAIILAAATALAAYLPARRAARLDPVAALREE